MLGLIERETSMWDVVCHCMDLYIYTSSDGFNVRMCIVYKDKHENEKSLNVRSYILFFDFVSIGALRKSIPSRNTDKDVGSF